MKEFLKDNILEIMGIIAIIGLVTQLIILMENKNDERLAIINNTKENVKKYEKCEMIGDYYYCWNEK